MDYIARYDSPLGRITMASDGTALAGLWWDGQRYFAQGVNANPEEEERLPVFNLTRHWLDAYFKGKVPDFLPPLLLRGTEFRRRVWQELLHIPYGQLLSYGEIAHRITCGHTHQKAAARAVGGAVGHNPVSLIVPCHRVIGKNGTLTGYAGGLERKAGLLQWEQDVLANGHVKDRGQKISSFPTQKQVPCSKTTTTAGRRKQLPERFLTQLHPEIPACSSEIFK